MGQGSTWDRQSWVVTPAASDPFTVTTAEGATWAVRALRAAGFDGLRPTDGSPGGFAMLIGKVRNVGLQIEEVRANEERGRLGFHLAGAAECETEAPK